MDAFFSSAARILFALLAVAVVWRDWRYRKIPNGLLAAGFAAVLVIGAGGAAASPDHWAAWHRLGEHAAVAAALGVGLWLLKIWPAGDAKLFILLALLTVLMNPERRYAPERYSVILLSNMFLPAALWAVLDAAREMRFSTLAVWARSLPPRQELARTLRVDCTWAGCLSLLGTLLFFGLNARIGEYAFLAVFVSIISLRIWLPPWVLVDETGPYYKALAPFALLIVLNRRLIGDGWGPATAHTAAGALGMTILYRTVLEPLTARLRRAQSGSTAVGELAPGVILSDSVKGEIAASADGGSDGVGPFYADGLMGRQVEIVRSWASRRGLTHVPTMRAEPFAGWMCVGAVLTSWGHLNLAAALRAAAARVL